MTRLVEYIVKNLERSYIFEMAYERREYMNKLFELRLQLVENWALIRYCSLYDNENLNKNHWKKELFAHISNLNKMKLKVDKTRATEQELIDKAEFNNVENIIKIIEFKFEIEDLTNDETIRTIAEDFTEYGLNELITIISNNNLTATELKDYLDTI
jgi:ethanolamine utilization protein EutP (predicted NTPase)